MRHQVTSIDKELTIAMYVYWQVAWLILFVNFIHVLSSARIFFLIFKYLQRQRLPIGRDMNVFFFSEALSEGKADESQLFEL